MALGKLPVLEREELGELIVDLGVAAAERGRRDGIGAGRAPHPEIDAPRMQCLERAKHFDDVQRRVIRHHDAAGAEADPLRARGCGRDQHLGRARRDARHVVVLGEPVPQVAELVGAHGEVDRLADRAARRHVDADG